MTGMAYCVPPILGQRLSKQFGLPLSLPPLIHCSKRSPTKEDPPGRAPSEEEIKEIV